MEAVKKEASSSGVSSFGQKIPAGLSDKGKALHYKLQGILRAPSHEAQRSVVGTPYCNAGVATQETVNPAVFQDLHEYYVEYSKLEPLAAIEILRRFLCLSDHLQVQNNLFLANWLWEAGRRELGASRLLKQSQSKAKGVQAQITALLDESGQLLRRGVIAFEDATSNSGAQRTQSNFNPGGKKLLEGGLRTCYAFALRHRKEAQTQVSTQWRRVTQINLADAPIGVAYFVGLANFALASVEGQNGASAKWKSLMTSSLAAFTMCNNTRMMTVVQVLLADGDPVARNDTIQKVMEQAEHDLGGDGPPQPVQAAQQHISPSQPAVEAMKLFEAGKVAEALDAARAADKTISDAKLDVTFLQHKVTIKVLEVQACCQLGYMKAAEKACRELHTATDRCEGHVDAHPLARANLIWRQLRAECFSRQSKPADALRMLEGAVPFAEATNGPLGAQMAALRVDCIVCRLELHLSGTGDQVEELQKDLDCGIAALAHTQPPEGSTSEQAAQWLVDAKLKSWLHVWRGLQAASGDGLDVDKARALLDVLADRFNLDRRSEPVAAWQAAESYLKEESDGLLKYLPFIAGMGFNVTTILFLCAILIPSLIGLWLILYALQIV